MTRRASRKARLPLTALALLGLAWTFAPGTSTPPLYDGLGFPDEPYRYVAPPPGSPTTAAATAISYDSKVTRGRAALIYTSSAEQGPQVRVLFGVGALQATDATIVHLRAQPIAPSTQPGDGRVWGNVYRLSATSDNGPVHLRPRAITNITLRAPSAPPPQPIIEYRDHTGWHPLRTTRTGNDYYSASIVALGDYAIVRPRDKPAAPDKGTSSNTTTLLVALGAVLIVLVGAITAIRIAGSRAARHDELDL